MKLLIVEDENELAASILAYINNEGFNCDLAPDFDKSIELLNINEYDCALVDIMLPGGSGLDVIIQLKKVQPRCGIIVISAKNSIDDKISGLNLGADDYLTKPFNLAELNARIKSVIRRRFFDGSSIINIYEISIETEQREVFVNKTKIDLTRREYEILLFFISNREKVLTKEAIIEHAWGENSNAFGNLDFVYTHIKNLRKKITDSGGGDYIRSVYGVGYKFSLK